MKARCYVCLIAWSRVVCLLLQLKRFLSEAVLKKEYGDNLAVK